MPEHRSPRLGDYAPAVCYHENVERVTLISGDVVGAICADCLADVPKEWPCDDCDWVDMTTLNSLQPQYTLARPCRVHAHL